MRRRYPNVLGAHTSRAGVAITRALCPAACRPGYLDPWACAEFHYRRSGFGKTNEPMAHFSTVEGYHGLFILASVSENER